VDDSIGITPRHFGPSGAGKFTLAAAKSKTVTVTFAPKSAGNFTGTIKSKVTTPRKLAALFPSRSRGSGCSAIIANERVGTGNSYGVAFGEVSKLRSLGSLIAKITVERRSIKVNYSKHLHVFLLGVVFLVVGVLTVRAETPENATPAEQAAVARQAAAFSKLRVRVETESDDLEVTALFTLGEHSNGINPLNQSVSLKVGDFSTTIPPNSFKTSPIGWFKYEGTLNGVDLEVRIVPLGSNRYAFRAEASAKGLTAPAPGKAEVELSIGDNTGKASARVERNWL